MNFWTLVHFLSFCVYTFAIFYVITKNPFAIINWVLSVLFFYFALWSACSTILDNSLVDMATAAVVMKVQSVGWASFIAYYFLFMLFMTNNKKMLSNPFLHLGLVLLPLIFVFQNYSGEVLVCCKNMGYGIGGTWKNGFWAYAYFAYYIILFFWGTFLLVRHRNTTRVKSEKHVAEVMIISAGAVFTIGTVGSVIMNYIGVYNPVDVNVVFLIFVGGFIYSAEKYETFNLSSTRNADRIMELIDEGVMLLDNYGALTSANRAAMEIFGFHEGQVSESIAGFIENQIKNAGVAASGTEATNVETTFIDFLGKRKTVLISSRQVIKDQNASGRIFSVRDITGKRKADLDLVDTVRELKRSNEELEDFAYVASHDLKEPLRMVTSYVQLIRKKFMDKLGADGNDYINFASDGAIRMSGLIEGLLEYSRVRKAQKDINDVDTGEEVNNVISMMKFKIQDRHASVTVEGKLPVIKAEKTHIEQLFQNLIGNALKFTDGRPPVVIISAEKSGEQYTFMCRDNGIGMEMQYKEKIFQIFQRLNSREEYEGTGMGLAICRKIVESHGGRIWVESEGMGKGSTFKFTLPA